MYSSDLKDKDWETIRHYFEFSNGYGNRAIHPRRNLVNGILYIVKTGCQWRMLPKEFPPWKTVYGYFRRLSKLGVWGKVLKDLVKIKRMKSGRNEHPSLMIVDAQSVKTAGKGEKRGFDGGKKIKGRKRQIAVDTQGNVHQVFVHKANIHDSKGGAILAYMMLEKENKIKKFLVDLGYRGLFEKVIKLMYKKSVEFSSKIVGEFIIQPVRWVVERTLAWLNWSRRLSKDYEQKCLHSENIIRISAIALLLRQIH